MYYFIILTHYGTYLVFSILIVFLVFSNIDTGVFEQIYLMLQCTENHDMGRGDP